MILQNYEKFYENTNLFLLQRTRLIIRKLCIITPFLTGGVIIHNRLKIKCVHFSKRNATEGDGRAAERRRKDGGRWLESEQTGGGEMGRQVWVGRKEDVQR